MQVGDLSLEFEAEQAEVLLDADALHAVGGLDDLVSLIHLGQFVFLSLAQVLQFA